MALTSVLIRVIAAGGKFLGDDIGGAVISIRDVSTGVILDHGVTSGGSGPKEVMCSSITRQQKIPDDGAAGFTANLSITLPTQIEIKAHGPLAARGSANTASVTTWVYPGRNIPPSSSTTPKNGNGIVLELPGLICQIVHPTTHNTTFNAPAEIEIVANVAMMCGCPISSKDTTTTTICKAPGVPQPWLPGDFTVMAVLSGPKTEEAITLKTLEWDGPDAGRFVGSLSKLPIGTYKMTVWAQQESTGNTGVDLSTFVVNDTTPAPPLLQED